MYVGWWPPVFDSRRMPGWGPSALLECEWQLKNVMFCLRIWSVSISLWLLSRHFGACWCAIGENPPVLCASISFSELCCCQEHGNLSECEASRVIAAVLRMISTCHKKGICYGDVKPANFMFKANYPCNRHLVDSSAPKGNIVLKGIDFGCSQVVRIFHAGCVESSKKIHVV